MWGQTVAFNKYATEEGYGRNCPLCMVSGWWDYVIGVKWNDTTLVPTTHNGAHFKWFTFTVVPTTFIVGQHPTRMVPTTLTMVLLGAVGCHLGVLGCCWTVLGAFGRC